MTTFNVSNLAEIEKHLATQPYLSGGAFPNAEDVRIFSELKGIHLLIQESPTKRPTLPSTTGTTSSISSPPTSERLGLEKSLPKMLKLMQR